MITTSESNQESKSNMAEVRKVVSASCIQAYVVYIPIKENPPGDFLLFLAQRSETVLH